MGKFAKQITGNDAEDKNKYNSDFNSVRISDNF